MRRIKKKELVMNLCLLVLSMVIFLFFFEVILYTIGYDNQHGVLYGLVRKDNITDFSLNPNFYGRSKRFDFDVIYQTNGDGFRDYDHDLSSDSFKIMALGDSQTWGTGVDYEETFLYLLERDLREDVGGIEIFKMGVPGYGTDNELALFREYYPRYKPDMVILVFHPNDVLDNIVWGEEYINKKGVKHSIIERFFFVHSYLRKKLKFYDFIYMRFENLPLIKGFKGGVDLPNNYKHLFLNVDTSDTKKGFDNSFAYLDEFIEESEEKDFKLVVVIVSSVNQFRKSNRELLQVYADEIDTTVNITKPNDVFSDYLESRGIPVIDTFDEFSKYPNPEVLFLPVDGHWSYLGHQIVADLIYKRLINQGFLPIK